MRRKHRVHRHATPTQFQDRFPLRYRLFSASYSLPNPPPLDLIDGHCIFQSRNLVAILAFTGSIDMNAFTKDYLLF